jgi:hypothetical protein
MSLNGFEDRLQQILQLRVARRRNEVGCKRIIDDLVIDDFVVKIGFVEFDALQL